MTKHTPGPWKHEKHGSNAFQIRPDIAWLGSVMKDENEANARLIAAAPKMYELLKRALPLLDEVGVHDHLADSDGAQELIKDIEKLIDGEEE